MDDRGIGFHDHSDGQDNVGTITFVPGVQFSYPVLDNWWLKPFGQLGFGKDFSGSDIAWIYGIGISFLIPALIVRKESFTLD